MDAKETEKPEVETKATVTAVGAVRVFTAEREDGTRLNVTGHADGTLTIRIGRGGDGPSFTLSENAANLLLTL